MRVDFTEESKSDKEFVVCELGRSEEKDVFVLGVLQNNDIEGVLKFSSLTLDDKSILSYDTTGKVSLNSFLKEELDKDQVLSLLISTLNLLNELFEFDIDSNFLVLDFERVYVDISKTSLEFICLPVEVNSGNNADVIKFLKEILLVANFSHGENLKYVSELLQLLNHQKQISPRMLLNRVIEMKTEVQKIEEAPSVNERKTRITAYVDQDGSITESEVIREAQVQSEKKTDEVRKNIKKIPKINLLKDHSEQTFGETLKGFFLGKGTPKKVESKNKVSPVRKMKQPGVYQKVAKVQKPRNKGATLLRETTEEKIPLESGGLKTYKIGSGKGADYVVSDNAAVSRNHAIFVNETDGYYIVDNETINGTFVNDSKIEFRYGPLKHKDKITLANENFEFLER